MKQRATTSSIARSSRDSGTRGVIRHARFGILTRLMMKRMKNVFFESRARAPRKPKEKRAAHVRVVHVRGRGEITKRRRRALVNVPMYIQS